MFHSQFYSIKNGRADDIFEQQAVFDNPAIEESNQIRKIEPKNQHVKKKRNAIAKAMWVDYKTLISRYRSHQ